MQATPEAIEEVYENCFSILRNIVIDNASFTDTTAREVIKANILIASTTDFELKRDYCYMLACACDALKDLQEQFGNTSETNLSICHKLLHDFRKRCAPLFNKMQSFLPVREPMNKRFQM